MKLTFTYTESMDISSLSRDELYHSYLMLPDSVRQLPDAKEQVLSIANLVGQLTEADLHITCKELELENCLIKSLTEKTILLDDTLHLMKVWFSIFKVIEIPINIEFERSL
ncbi:MAG: hypothetical protein KF770_30235 [Anaerolineae bacterium]|nr:hypothetical protein [Anaerolineae bacterium]